MITILMMIESPDFKHGKYVEVKVTTSASSIGKEWKKCTFQSGACMHLHQDDIKKATQ